ncbi:phage tail sheath subtilisin-like domain-containing protein [Pyxidicoccus parkwayensis]|uniref:Phage tail sheath subtilisin-like domain-containing protein n=1 Tax=Pyxidicoccus parkwayensis TaxID=2813578 RepID=A0ABX7NVC3_9BACT|nr:phage tail sheath C-terminal domain-containing protein [Pyxidicoccus parkwaysis]QSQ22760.1 phage tail sheath subtilisin-like domain-containing protein [Pyxidicoccus parkwaysis]
MATYLHPGVYLEEIPSGAKPIEGVATSLAAFVGAATRGPLATPVLVHSLEEYERTFGSISSEQDAMGFAVLAYYQNGGKDAYIARVADPTGAVAAFATLNNADTSPDAVLKLSATSPGEWGNSLYYRVTRGASTAAPTFTLEVGHMELVDGLQRFKADLTFPNLSMNERSPSYALAVVNGESSPVKLELADPSVVSLLDVGKLTGAALHATSVPANYFTTFGLPEEMSFSLNLDALGTRNFTLLKTPLALGGTDAAADAGKIATAIQLAVRGISATDAPFKDFTCAYDSATRRFVLTSPKSSFASVEVYDTGTGPTLAKAMKLDPASTPTAAHGALMLTPATVSASSTAKLGNGAASAPRPEDFQAVFGGALKKIRDITTVLLPGNHLPSSGVGNGAVTAALAHCEEMRNRVLIVDPEPGFELTSASRVDQLKLPTSTYAVAYYPWAKVANPFYKAEAPGTKSPTVKVAPSAFAAGMWSRIDSRRGVWKAPAGVETGLTGVAGLEFVVDDGVQDQLNPLGVNALRALPNFGSVIWGARTLATKADPEWRYVSVRRTAILIEQSVYNGIQWAVFEPNDHRLHAALRTNIGSFMDGLFRAGAFQGEKASDAYFVRCGLGDTMTQGDIDRGQVIVVVGFAPLKAAEFVIVRIQQKLQQ